MLYFKYDTDALFLFLVCSLGSKNALSPIKNILYSHPNRGSYLFVMKAVMWFTQFKSDIWNPACFNIFQPNQVTCEP